MTGFVSIILLPVRYSMVIGLDCAWPCYIIINLILQGTGGTDFERILPAAINNFLPVGILGIVLTGLLGAFMGTFSGTLNAAQAYIVNDIYLKYVNPNASNKKIITMNYLVGYCCSGNWCITWFFCKGCEQYFAMDRFRIIWWLYCCQYV